MVEELAAGEPLSAEEAAYVAAARAQNTMRGYASDWREFTAWCAQHDRAPLPAAASTVTAYLSDLAAAGAKVGTMSRRLSALKFVAGSGRRHLHRFTSIDSSPVAPPTTRVRPRVA